MDNEKLIKGILSRLDSLKAKRGRFPNQWEDVADLVMPRKSGFLSKKQNGGRRSLKQFESTATNAAELLAASLHGYLTNPAADWFNLRISGLPGELSEQEEIKEWLEESTETLRTEFNRPPAAFSTNIHETYLDLVTFGTAGLFMGWNDKEDSLLFQSRYLGELYIDEDATGVVDTVIRVFTLDARKIVQQWGLKSLPSEIRSGYDDNKQTQEFEIVHAIYPNENYNPQLPNIGKNWKIMSVYLLRSKRHILNMGGYNEMPLFVPRWIKASGEVFGRSPAISCLSDIQMIQEMMKETLISAQLANRPPVMVPDDETFSPRSTIPGGIMYYNRIAPQPFNPNVQPRIGLDIMNEIRGRINTSFYIDRMLTPQKSGMTATEVLQITQDNMRVLGPIQGRMQSELFGPMISRGFGLLQRRGRIKPIPQIELPEGEEFVEAKLTVEYISPLAMAQKQAAAGNMARAIELATPFFQLNPQSALNVDCNEGVRKVFDLFSSSSVLASPDDVDEIVQAQQQAQEKAAAEKEALSGLQLAGAAKEINADVQ